METTAIPTDASSPGSTRRRRITITALIAGIVLIAIGGAATAALAVGPPDGTLRYTWSIGDRYGLDADSDGIVDDHDGITDLAKDKAFIQTPTYQLTFDSCASPAVTDRTSVITGFTVTLTGAEAKTVDGTSCKQTVPVTKLGTFTAKVEIKVGPVTVDSRTETIAPKDDLLVSVGDSVASGEGNPDTVVSGTNWTPKWENEQCHRTSLAGPAQAALRMERRDPHSSVTFIHLACSGASITQGLLGDYAGQDPSKGTMLKPQLDQLAELVGPRAVDAMTVSIGANDAEFSAVVKACLVQTNCHLPNGTGQKNGVQLFDEKAPLIEKNYALLDARLDKMAKQQAGDVKLKGKVFVTEYMDVTKDDDGSYCTGKTQKEKDAGAAAGGTSNTDGLNAEEMKWADTYVEDGLNQRVNKGIATANANGGAQIQFVGGIKSVFAKHGYCAQDRYIRTLAESLLYQRGIDGAFHPNAEGHLYAYANKIEDAVAPALGIEGTKAPLEFDTAGQLGDALNSWIATLDRTGGLDALTNALPFGARDQVQTFLRDEFFGKFLPKIQQAATDGITSVTELSERLDDLDGDGKPGVDTFGLANINLDVTGDIEPKLPSKTYDITFTIKGDLAVDPDIALKAGQVGLSGQKTKGTAAFSQTVKLHIDFTKKKTEQFYLTIPQDGLNGSIKINLAGDFGGADGPANGPDQPAISFTSGGLGLKAVGQASANVDLGYSIKDPNGDGRIDATEIGNPLSWVQARCASGAAKVDLKASASLVGFTSALGRITLDDPNLCDGVDLPKVDLAELGEFQGVTMIDFVNGLAQLTTALKGIQTGNDVDIPFVKEGLSGVISANEKLVRFFTDNGLTDPTNPMATITFDPKQRPDLDTIDELLPKLATALGVPLDTLNPRVVDRRLLLDLSTTIDPAAKTGAGSLDFGDQLSKTGLTEITGTAKATIDPALTIKLGLGIDLRPDLALGDRFFLQLADGAEITADAKVTADAQLTAGIALLDVDLADDNAAGAVTLLDRKDPAKPLLSIDIKGTVDGTPDDNRLTLNELTTPTTGAKSPIKVTLNGKVPTFGLNASAKLAGSPFATGKVTIGWPDISDPAQLSVAMDGNFQNLLLPFAYDPSNPRATLTGILNATHTGVAKLRAALATNPQLIRTLPLIGKSAGELDPMLAKLEDRLATLIEIDETLTLDQLEARIEKELGTALGVANDQWPGLLSFRYEKQGDKGAALLADLNIGFCSNDRKALPGCSKVSELGPYPLNLALGQSADSMAAVTSDGKVTISYDARLKLTVGIELPKVTVSAAGVPVFPTTVPRIFVADTSSLDLGIGANVTGQFAGVLGPVEVKIGNGTKAASASLAARYSLKSSTANAASPQRIYDTAIPAWVTTLVPDPSKGGNVHDTTATKSTCTPAADACAVLPITINNTYVGDITFRAPDLLSPSGWSVDGQQVLDNLHNENIQYAILIGGIESFVERLEASLRSMPADKTIPLLGVNPTAGADVLEDFRKGFVEPAQDLVNTINAANRASVVRANIQDFVFAKIGPDSALKLLRDGPDTGTDITKADVVVDLSCKIDGVVKACADNDSPLKIEDLQLKVPLAKTATVTSKPLDSGFPGLRLKSDEGFSAGVGFEMDLAFGIDRTNGFYIPTKAFGTQPELRVQATASLPANVDAQLAFIPVKIADKDPGVPDVAAVLGVDLASGGSDDKITLGQLGSAQITPSVQACADVRLGLETGASKRFPAIKADLSLNGGYNCLAGGVTGAPANSGGIGIGFDNVRVNAGSVINDFVGPAAEAVRKYTGPLEPTIDALRQPIPGVKEAARAVGAPQPTWWDLMNAVNEVRKGAGEADQLAMIKKVMLVSDLARQLAPGVGNAQDISLGSFKLDTAKAQSPSGATDIDSLLTDETYADGGTSVISRLQGAGIPIEVASKVQREAQYQSLTFPAFEKPQMLFELLLGKDVPLVRFEAGGSFLHVPIGPYSFPVGPATLYFGGALDVGGHFSAGFDTYGIRQAYSMLTDDDPTNDSFGQAATGLLGGFYLDDNNAKGEDVPELRAQAEVTVGAGIGIPGFGVFAEGGVHGDASIDLKTTDGKLRPEALIKQLRKNPNPVCVFDAKAHIDAFVRVVVSNPVKDVTFPIADSVVLDEPDLTDFCNTQQTDTQEKLTGKQYTDGTLEVFTTAQSDHILVTQRSTAGTVDVSSKGVVETFTGIKKVFVDAAAGDDQVTITADTPRASAISAWVCGGAGRDRIAADSGPATLYGDAGQGTTTVENGVTKSLPCTAGPGSPDSLHGGPDADLIVGGDGGDDIVGGAGADKLQAGNGDDTILPGTGDDTVDGGANTDAVSYADVDTDMTVDLRDAKTSGATGTAEKDTFTGIETGVGGPRNDTLLAPPVGAVLDGGSGNDTLQGDAGIDVLIGGSGNDTLFGAAGDDLLAGSFGDDRLVGNEGGDLYRGSEGTDTADFSAEPGPVTITINGQADDGRADQDHKDDVADAEIVLGTTGNDQLAAGVPPAELHGRDGDDTVDGPGKLYGEAGTDLLRGSPGDDELYGGDADDELRGNKGNDKLEGGTGRDLLDGGLGADSMSGGADFDTADYSSRTGNLTIYLTNGAVDGEGDVSHFTGPDCSGSTCDEVKPDNEKIVGGSGNDTIGGDNGDQTLVGGAGTNVLIGYAGIDTFVGGDGKDDATDGDAAQSRPDPAGKGDTYLLGKGDDVVHGSGGDEHIEAGEGDDTGQLSGTGKVFLDMGPGNDTFDTDKGDHTVIGGPGNDHLASYLGKKDIDMGEGDDVVALNAGAYATRADMGPGNDEFDGGNDQPGRDVVDGGPGADKLFGGGGDDALTDRDGPGGLQGGPGTDVLTTGTGTDTISGGDGNDTIVDGGSDGAAIVDPRQYINGDGGDDTITISGSSVSLDAVGGDAGNDMITGNDSAQKLQGGEGNDTLDGRGGDDQVFGEGGDDTVKGGDGDDWVSGSDGTNILVGGAGADRLEGGAGHDTVSYADRTSPVWVTQGGSAAYDDGNATDDSATVPGKRDSVAGSIDHLIGTPFDDTLAIGSLSSTEVARLEGLAGRDTLTSTDGASLEGGDGDDTLVGSPEVDTLDGGKGSDLLTGAGAADTEQGGEGDDRLDQGTAVDGGDRLIGGPGTDVADYSARPAAQAIAFTPGTGGADDGAAGEADDADATVESARRSGTPTPTPTVTLAPAKATAVAGETVNATVTVAGSAGTATGVVELTDNGVRAGSATLDGTGKATIGARFARAGTRTLTASFRGDSHYRAAASANVAVTVAKAATAVTLEALDTPTKTGTTTKLKVTVAPSTGSLALTGAVSIKEGTTPVQTFSVTDGQVTANLSTPLALGRHDLTATWAGDSDTTAATSPVATVLVTGDGKAPAPTVAVSTDPASPSSSTAVSFKAKVTPVTGASTPTGTVAFTATGTNPVREAVSLGSADLVAGTATLARPAGLPGGTYTVTAAYAGSATSAGATGSAPIVFGRTATTTTVASSLNPATTDAGIAFTATVGRTAGTGTPTGTVTFLDGTEVLGTAPLGPDGTARTTKPLLLGTHQVTARYEGSDTLAPSTSAALAQVVTTPSGTTGIATTTALVRTGNNLIATVAPASGTATGQVRFTIDGTAGSPVDLVGPTATTPLPSLAPGDHTVTAAYLGSPTHAPSTSAALKVTVTAGAAPSAPGTPTVTSATGTAASLSWTAPTNPGGSAVTAYRVTVKADAAGTVVATFETADANRTAAVTGLTPGHLYRFSVAARNATGIGAESALSATALPPFKSVDAFTTQQYEDFANRVPTAAELTDWRTKLANGSATPQSLVNLGMDFKHAAGITPITRLFNAYFGRLPDLRGLDYWTGKYRSGTKLSTISATFAASSEFKNKYGALTNRDFVLLIYKNVLQRTPDATGVDYWTAKLDKGAARGEVMTTFSESSEYKRKTAATTDLVESIRSMLVRVPTTAERTEWEAKLKAGAPRTDLLAWILAQPGYDARV
ncbi:Ig-like domain repeat protein [Aquihabitans sp. McL0605]|uniref:Ig-like domain repeat protein n=1 Tax=Aquihabitans sp. McL0605 TaxID=3415671 RepID=UPI003CED7C73